MKRTFVRTLAGLVLFSGLTVSPSSSSSGPRPPPAHRFGNRSAPCATPPEWRRIRRTTNRTFTEGGPGGRQASGVNMPAARSSWSPHRLTPPKSARSRWRYWSSAPCRRGCRLAGSGWLAALPAQPPRSEHPEPQTGKARPTTAYWRTDGPRPAIQSQSAFSTGRTDGSWTGRKTTVEPPSSLKRAWSSPTRTMTPLPRQCFGSSPPHPNCLSKGTFHRSPSNETGSTKQWFVLTSTRADAALDADPAVAAEPLGFSPVLAAQLADIATSATATGSERSARIMRMGRVSADGGSPSFGEHPQPLVARASARPS
jgi:hypothetical protein